MFKERTCKFYVYDRFFWYTVKQQFLLMSPVPVECCECNLLAFYRLDNYIIAQVLTISNFSVACSTVTYSSGYLKQCVMCTCVSYLPQIFLKLLPWTLTCTASSPQGSNLLQQKGSPPSGSGVSPVTAFVQLEHYQALQVNFHFSVHD